MNDLYQALITVDPGTFLAQICNLFIQLIILKKLLLEPVKKVLAERKAKADSQIADAQKLRADLKACGLPTELPCPQEKLMPAILNDKKIDEGGKLDFIYLKRIGKPVLKKRRISDITL